MRKSILLVSLLLIVFVMFSCSKQDPVAPESTQNQAINSLSKQGGTPLGEMTDEEILALMNEINENLASAGYDIRIEQVEFFTIGLGRPPVRIHQQPFRWAAGDPRRAAQGNDITYIIDDLNNAGPTSIGSFPTADVANGMTTWGANRALKKVNLVDRTGTAPFHIAGLDITIFDGELGVFCPVADLPGNGLLNFTAADIVHAGWYPASCFSPNTLAFSVTFIFGGGDANGDGYLDTALNEVYYNDFHNWATDGSNFDVETVALHENGHSLGIGHFGIPPSAVMNPIYAGVRHSLFPIDQAGMATIWNRWPK